MYSNPKLYEAMGKEICILYDIVMGASGCEAVVEGFYSLASVHKKSGGQKNDTLMERANVDWALPQPIQCPKTIKKIAKLYRDGNASRGLKKHRCSQFFDQRKRAASKYEQSKVIDRLMNEKAKFTFLVTDDL